MGVLLLPPSFASQLQNNMAIAYSEYGIMLQRYVTGCLQEWCPAAAGRRRMGSM